MNTSLNPEHPTICTVTEMARTLRLSRARFYQLLKQGILPPPVYCLTTRKPIYTQQLQEVCLHIRKTGTDVNGRFVRFYNRRPRQRANVEHKQLVTVLREMGLSVTAAQVRAALDRLRLPKSHATVFDAETIRKLFQYLHERCQRAV
jgi:hypothetical protein